MRVVIGDDEVLVREGLGHVLQHGGFEIVASVASATELVDRAASLRPDLIVTDIRMPPHHADDGLIAALQIRRQLPEIAIVVLSQYVQRRYAMELLEGNPSGIGYLLKQRVADIATFCADVRRVGAGGTALDPLVVERMLVRAGRGDDALSVLTGRQREIIAMMAEGCSNAAIARRISITEKAVVAHVSKIYDGLGLRPDDDEHRRVLAVVRFLNR